MVPCGKYSSGIQIGAAPKKRRGPENLPRWLKSRVWRGGAVGQVVGGGSSGAVSGKGLGGCAVAVGKRVGCGRTTLVAQPLTNSSASSMPMTTWQRRPIWPSVSLTHRIFARVATIVQRGSRVQKGRYSIVWAAETRPPLPLVQESRAERRAKVPDHAPRSERPHSHAWGMGPVYARALR